LSLLGVVAIVCGGRYYSDVDFFYQQMDYLHTVLKFALIVEGGQTGADALAKQWAIERNVPFEEVAADWKRYGRAAGPKRNGQMIKRFHPDCVVAFPGDRGTRNMIDQAYAANIPYSTRGWNYDPATKA
jgi:hypothetical protein